MLRDVEGLTAPEVAEVLGVSVDAVKSRLHRARAEVRARMQPRLAEAERAARAPTAESCPDIVRLFSRYTEGEIGPEDCAAMQRHVASCARCGAACASIERALALCRAAPQGDVPRDVQERVREALRSVGAASVSAARRRAR